MNKDKEHIMIDSAKFTKEYFKAKLPEIITSVRKHRLPFGITPHYISLMDDDLEYKRDRAVRAQVIPSSSYG